ncbi:MAG: type I 3-dehydroquinate dehydratase [Deltaproteobacteria bacterium]|nr:type I 3-dehydroquinate dehydratase [Deltaproteobacteria bacterium]
MICIPIMARNTDEAIRMTIRATGLADIIEFRLDAMESFDLERMIRTTIRPVIVTYRSNKEGGKGIENYELQTRHLLEAISLGAHYVDMEYSMPPQLRERILLNRGNTMVIVSAHLIHGTPPLGVLEDTLKRLAATGANIVKIVTMARRPEDNLRILDLVSSAKDLGIKVIAFCMGPLGRISRVASPLLGSYLTFASLEEGLESADGQISAREMKRMMEMLSA